MYTWLMKINLLADEKESNLEKIEVLFFVDMNIYEWKQLIKNAVEIIIILVNKDKGVM